MSPKILVWDIETTPALADVWQLFDVNVSLNQLREVSHVLCVAAKWVDQPAVKFFSDHHTGHDAMVGEVWKLLDEADAVVSFNGKSFDTKHMNREFVLAGAPPPSPFVEIDLCSVVKGRFKFQSGKLAHVSDQLGLGAKTHHDGHELWQRCMDGDEAAWRVMKRYNIQDVRLTEDLYKRLLPWIPPSMHPNQQVFGTDPESCPRCGEGPLQRRGFRYTPTAAFQRFQCQSCGGWSSSGKALARVDLRAA